MVFLQSLKLDGLLSFPPGAEAISLTPLNVLIGPNASGKSNLIEAVELLHATPTAFAAAIRDGGGAQEWIWKGKEGSGSATLEALIQGEKKKKMPDLRYRLAFASAGLRTELLDEAIEEVQKRRTNDKDVFFYYRFRKGKPVINVRMAKAGSPKDRIGRKSEDPYVSESPSLLGYAARRLERQSLPPDESVLSQRKDPDLYPELTWLGQRFGHIHTFREWSFGRYATLRQPQRADQPSDKLLPSSENVGLVVNELQNSDVIGEFNRLLARFLPRYQRFSTSIQGGSIQFYLHETGLKSPVPATRLSDGTIRFMAMLALMLSPTPPPLLCMEEPELGLHPDAVSLLADVLVDASSRTQLIVTTHSDALVSALSDHADSVLVCEYHGGTVLRRVESATLQHWLDQYRLGELWIQGKLGGNP